MHKLALVGLLVALVGGCSTSNEGDPTADVSTTAAPTTSTTAALTTSTTAAPAAAETWRRVGADTMESTVGLFDITQLGSRLIALGFDPGTDRRQDGVIFASDDRITWAHLAEGDPALTSGTALMYGITAGGPGLVSVGMSCEDDELPCIAGPYPTVWTSADGTAWTRTQLEQSAASSGVMLDVEVTEHGIVATGSIDEPAPGGSTASSPVAWLSPDGITWSRVWQGATVLDVEDPIMPNYYLL